MQVTGAARIRGTIPSARRQNGFFAMIVLVILVMGSLYAIVSGLNTAAAEARLHREDVASLALQQAKEALIARAALDLNRPGSLPCPDRDNDGIADLLAGNNCPSYIGRLPWKTLGLPDLRDAAGERLWYALSADFTDSDASAINSDTQGTLVVPGMAPTGGIVAIVFAPGTVVGTQTRGGPLGASADSPCTWGVHENCKVANYLEGQNASIDLTYELSPRCERGDCPVPFNDQLAIITHAELFAIVEPVVAKRIEKEIVPQLTNDAAADGYFERWGIALYPSTGGKQRGFFPFAAPYDDPARLQDQYRGVLDQTNGLLPMSRDAATWVTWTNVQVAPVGPGTIDTGSPTPSCSPGIGGLECSLTYTCEAITPGCGSGMGITLTARLQNVAKSLLLPTGLTDGSGWSVSPAGPGTITVAPSLDTATGDLLVTVTFAAAPTPPGPPTPLLITFPALTFSAVPDPAQWFAMNGWHRQTYYAVASRFHPTATRNLADPCPATPPDCISVVTGPPKARAVLVLAGRYLGTGVRTYTIANYFELENAVSTPFDASGTPAPDYVFEQKQRTKTFNDRLVVVAVEP
jgi:hypothetical protein